ncbi:MAG: 1-acyl-sn-glycerol-3-phosphate acyltransferase [Nitrospirae bacterium]|nr:1-acyl-sn-glycerol-3-phosphate acyltransferase [Nitrospirota bacterium]
MLYSFLKLASYIVFKFFFNLKINGRTNIPKKGGAILASNHASYSDILLIGCGIWRRLKYVAKAEMFRGFFLRFFWTYMGGIPVTRGGMNRDAFKRIIDQVEKGNLVVIFPEGTRSVDGRLKDARPGIGMLVAISGVKVIPTYISGSDKVLRRGSNKITICPVSVTYGEPIDFSEIIKKCEGKELYQKISVEIMARIDDLRIKNQCQNPPADRESDKISLK